MTASPALPRRVHFVGVGGIGLSALARLLLARGHQVSGSDRSPGEQGEELARLGAIIHAGHRADFVDGAELLVVTNAVPADNPEVAAARDRGIHVMLREELLAQLVDAGRGVAVAGTHGKTTTTALIGHIAVEAGLDPTVIVGGVSLNLGSNARSGMGDLVVAEADEYRNAFLFMHPRIAVITNVEPEHVDFFGTVERLHQAFAQFAGQVRDTLIVGADDPDLPRLVAGGRARLIGYGLQHGEVRAQDVRETPEITTFTVDGHAFAIRLAGSHNVRNALAAVVAARTLGVADDIIARALSSFAGTARRAEVKGEVAGILVIDDYGHHPTEIRSTLSALRQRYRRPMRVVFQPHTYSRTRAFLDDFARSFGDADALYLLDVYGHREAETLGISGRDLAEAASRYHPVVTYAHDHAGALAALLAEARPGDMVVTMGAGDVYQIGPRFLEGLQQRCQTVR